MNVTRHINHHRRRPAGADIGDVYGGMSAPSGRDAQTRRADRHQLPGLRVAHLMMLR